MIDLSQPVLTVSIPYRTNRDIEAPKRKKKRKRNAFFMIFSFFADEVVTGQYFRFHAFIKFYWRSIRLTKRLKIVTVYLSQNAS